MEANGSPPRAPSCASIRLFPRVPGLAFGLELGLWFLAIAGQRCDFVVSSPGRRGVTVLKPLEVASIILLLGAQVIAEYERLQDGDTATPGELTTESQR